MAGKSANVTARVEPEVKERAEAIMESLGISASTAINMFYRQIILWNGMPFRPVLPKLSPLARDELSRQQFDERMAAGLAQAKADEGSPLDVSFDRLQKEISDG